MHSPFTAINLIDLLCNFAEHTAFQRTRGHVICRFWWEANFETEVPVFPQELFTSTCGRKMKRREKSKGKEREERKGKGGEGREMKRRE